MKRKIRIALLLFVTLMFSLLAFTACVNDNDENGAKQVPVYQGMTITKSNSTLSLTSASYISSGVMLLDSNNGNHGDNGNHYGHYNGDHADRNDTIDEDNPYPDNNANENIEEEMNAVRLSIAQNVDGVIICPCQKGTETIELLERSGVPFVLIGRHFGAEINTHYVVCDDKGGAQMAINHLISMGHRSIAFVKADSPISSNTERFEGYKQALSESNIPFNEDIILTIPLTGGENKAKIREFIKANPQCTAIVAFSDILAYEVINTLNSLGISVPEEVSVIGFDNICSDYTLPLQLTSISISKKNMAHKACKILQTLMSKKDTEMQSSEKMQVVLPTCVFIRETTKRKE